MPPIKNWEKTIDRDASEVKKFRASTGIVKRWEHVETGDTITIERVEAENPELYHGGVWYDIKYNGESVTAKSSLRKAKRGVAETMRQNPEGL